MAGRAAQSVRAVPRTGAEGATAIVFGLGPGADELELAVDAERGALLRVNARLRGEPFRRLEVTEITFGPIPAESTEPALPPGVVASGWLRPERLPLHELQRAAPFRVLAPARIPDGWRLVESLFTTARAHPAIEAEVSLVYASPDGAYTVVVGQRAASATRRDWLEWTRDRELALPTRASTPSRDTTSASSGTGRSSSLPAANSRCCATSHGRSRRPRPRRPASRLGRPTYAVR